MLSGVETAVEGRLGKGSAKLTHEHDNTGSEGSATVTSDGEKLDNSGSTGGDGSLFLQESVDHEEVASGLKLGMTKTAKGFVSLAVTSFADEPARTGKKSQLAQVRNFGAGFLFLRPRERTELTFRDRNTPEP